MKVIYNSNNDVEKITRKFTCQNCESILEATIKELGPKYPDSRDGDYYNVKCPICGAELYLSAEAVKNNTLYVPECGKRR